MNTNPQAWKTAPSPPFLHVDGACGIKFFLQIWTVCSFSTVIRSPLFSLFIISLTHPASRLPPLQRQSLAVTSLHAETNLSASCQPQVAFSSLRTISHWRQRTISSILLGFISMGYHHSCGFTKEKPWLQKISVKEWFRCVLDAFFLTSFHVTGQQVSDLICPWM